MKLKKPAKVNFIQGHIATTFVPVNEARYDVRDKPATAMEDDLSENEDDSNFGDDNSSTEDDMIRATISNDGDSEDCNVHSVTSFVDPCCCVSLFNVQRTRRQREETAMLTVL